MNSEMMAEMPKIQTIEFSGDAAQERHTNTISIEVAKDATPPEIKSGDILKVLPGAPVTEHDLALVILGDNVACRRIKRYASGIYLIPGIKEKLPEFYSMEELEGKGFKILGKVTERIRRY